MPVATDTFRRAVIVGKHLQGIDRSNVQRYFVHQELLQHTLKRDTNKIQICHLTFIYANSVYKGVEYFSDYHWLGQVLQRPAPGFKSRIWLDNMCQDYQFAITIYIIIRL